MTNSKLYELLREMSKRHFIPRVMEKAAAGRAPDKAEGRVEGRTLALLQEDWDDLGQGMAKA